MTDKNNNEHSDMGALLAASQQLNDEIDMAIKAIHDAHLPQLEKLNSITYQIPVGLDIRAKLERLQYTITDIANVPIEMDLLLLRCLKEGIKQLESLYDLVD